MSEKNPNSPCFSCQFYRRLDFDGHWIFRLPNPPNFAQITDEHAWCIIEVLDRYPQPLYEGQKCSRWESRAIPQTLTHEDIVRLHPMSKYLKELQKK